MNRPDSGPASNASKSTATPYLPTQTELLENFLGKYGKEDKLGASPRLRLSYNYFTPEDYYETVVGKLIGPDTAWADIGCGRHVFPSNAGLAETLAGRAKFFFGIDPDDNIRDNKFVDAYFQGMVEDCDTEHRFDVITMRMVAEHIVAPERALKKISDLLLPGGKVVIYTPNKWAPMSIVADIVPFRWHNTLKRLIWNTEARDTFPTAYKLNTRNDLLTHTRASGLEEVHFQLLDDCRTFTSFLLVNRLELLVQGQLSRIGVHYPENCILAIYQKRG